MSLIQIVRNTPPDEHIKPENYHKLLKKDLVSLVEYRDCQIDIKNRLEEKFIKNIKELEREKQDLMEEAGSHFVDANHLREENEKLRETLKYYWSQGLLGEDHGIRGEEDEDWDEELEKARNPNDED